MSQLIAGSVSARRARRINPANLIRLPAGLLSPRRSAIVTGGYSGIGLETTRALRSAGAKVIIRARDHDTAASQRRRR
jgi:hypothetical protein